jgi:hypothetical protein
MLVREAITATSRVGVGANGGRLNYVDHARRKDPLRLGTLVC